MTQFNWGAATSAYQIEGGRGEDGKADSIWDLFSDAGRLKHKGDEACDHYHRLEEDLDLLAGLGVNAYRFSVAWSRVIPDGDGPTNPAGIDFYRRLVSGLNERGIAPCLTIYHWDLPAALHHKGGWLSRDTAHAFARYAEVMAKALGDDVAFWITHNEPWVASMLGYTEGVFAPGVTGMENGLTAAHNMLVSHGLATRAIRQASPDAKVGIALDCRPSVPATDDDVEATRHFDGYRNRWFFDPVFGKGYPEDMVDLYGERGLLSDRMNDESDQALIGQPIDFLGVNYYTTVHKSKGEEETDPPEGPMGAPAREGFTEMGWKIDPTGLTSFLERVHTDYSPSSMLVTENGASYSDEPDKNGRIRDTRRIDYLSAHIEATLDARKAGVRVDGYFVWSLLDNLEWLEGWDQRFGLVWVDPETKTRIPKDSYYWYRDRVVR